MFPLFILFLLPESSAVRLQASHTVRSLAAWAASPPNTSVPIYVKIINTTDGFYGSDRNYAIEALSNLACSAKVHHYPGPLVALTVGLAPEYATALRAGGFQVVDKNDKVDLMKSIYKPMYTLEEVRRAGIQYPDNKPGGVSIQQWPLQNRSDFLQERRDGWATYFAFELWEQVQHSRLLSVDADVCVLGDMEPGLMALSKYKRNDFIATTEIADRSWLGMSGALLYLQPSMRVAAMLRRAAAARDYLPYTNGEQDVLESKLAMARPADQRFFEEELLNKLPLQLDCSEEVREENLAREECADVRRSLEKLHRSIRR